MIAQLSQRQPFGRALSSSMGVIWAGFFIRNSGERVEPQTSVSAKSSPAARAKTRTAMLLTLGLSMLMWSDGFFAGFGPVFPAASAPAFDVGFASAREAL